LSEIDSKKWADILKAVKSKNNALYALLRMAKVEVSGNNMKLTFPFKFHASRFDDSKLLSNFKNTAAEYLGKTPVVEVTVDSKVEPSSGEIVEDILVEEEIVDEKLSAIIDTFGGGEVVEL